MEHPQYKFSKPGFMFRIVRSSKIAYNGPGAEAVSEFTEKCL
jgi:hypothetical protein